MTVVICTEKILTICTEIFVQTVDFPGRDFRAEISLHASTDLKIWLQKLRHNDKGEKSLK